MPLKSKIESYKHFFRDSLSESDALPQLALLGLFSGLITAFVIVCFRWAIESTLAHVLPNGDPENFEGLSITLRMVLPLSGAVLIAIIWYRLKIAQRKTGVIYVMERLSYHQGYISFKALVTQFVAGFLTIVSGQSSGREGPAVHLGAAASSLMGQYFRLPNNSIRTLVACGTAAAISASFNTPIAGVIFAMEVVMMEYSMIGFTPVIIASVSAAFASQIIYGPDPAFFVPQLYLSSPFEIPFIIFCGLIIGLLSSFFVRLTTFSMTATELNIAVRILIAGAITASFAYVFPEIMGIGYDTVHAAIAGQLGFALLCAIALAKLVTTSISVGLGMPNGIIGPTLFIGATAGAAMGIVAQWLMPEIASSTGFYAMLGMGAMMGSALQAPLAALMALLELTQNPNIILSGMLIIVVSSMFSNAVFKQKSIFLSILEAQGLKYNSSPAVQALRRVGVLSIMERKFIKSNKVISWEDAEALLRQGTNWIIIQNDRDEAVSLLPAVDLVRFMESCVIDGKEKPEQIKLLEIPAQRRDLAPIYYQATLEEALNRLENGPAQALYVERNSGGLTRTLGVLTQSDIEKYYQYKGQ